MGRAWYYRAGIGEILPVSAGEGRGDCCCAPSTADAHGKVEMQVCRDCHLQREGKRILVFDFS